jgi:hypothetical protein
MDDTLHFRHSVQLVNPNSDWLIEGLRRAGMPEQ